MKTQARAPHDNDDDDDDIEGSSRLISFDDDWRPGRNGDRGKNRQTRRQRKRGKDKDRHGGRGRGREGKIETDAES